MKRYGILALICILLVTSFAACRDRDKQGNETDDAISGVQTDESGASDEGQEDSSDPTGDSGEGDVGDKPGDLAQGEWDPQP